MEIKKCCSLSEQDERLLTSVTFKQISGLIDDYLTEHSDEMLPKSPSTLEAVYRSGKSAIIITEEGQAIAHAALWDLVDLPEIDIAVTEFGSWIVDPQYRHHQLNGNTIGEEVASSLLQAVNLNQVGVISTVKRLNSLKGLKKIGGQLLSFGQFPFITGLTCVCEKTSEHFNQSSCEFRRRPGFGEAIVDESQIISTNLTFMDNGIPKIPCALVGFNPKTLIGINNRLATLYQQYAGQELPDSPLITTEIMHSMGDFYINYLGLTL